ncbi:hypothetical protein BB559_006529 [Furculomyces boomerangus]|uniref:Folylpolyglutamate synthase n=2 Tax=Harpellales TaxID=61421 RepID=A0A2T9Y249_9FUNG|nr:hypothetical protein BB559_006529 [Furculomyces boomerangus]
MYSTKTYNESIELLNSLQSNASTLDQIRKHRKEADLRSIPEMIQCFKRIGYNPVDFNRLNAIHISGTKGKGSTSAFVERILREFGKTITNQSIPVIDKNNNVHNHTSENELFEKQEKFKTGLFTSPHMIEVRERIRLDGVPISKDLFTKYFFQVWEKFHNDSDLRSPLNTSEKVLGKNENILNHNVEHDEKLISRTEKPIIPSYFRFLTLLAFHVFVQEGVSVAVIETGIGGEYDSTNILVSPTVCGITSIGLDHVDILGNSIPEIALQKAGIMKKGSVAISAPDQDSEAIKVFEKVAEERHCEFKIAKTLDQYIQHTNSLKLHAPEIGIAGEHQVINAALAVELCFQWMKRSKWSAKHPEAIQDTDIENTGKYLPEWVLEGLKKTKWPGRSHSFIPPKHPNIKWFLDGAHTKDSMNACVQWFLKETNNSKTPCILIFSPAHGRNKPELIKELIQVVNKRPFLKIIFCNKITFNPETTNKNIAHNPKELNELLDSWKNVSLENTCKNTTQNHVNLTSDLEKISLLNSINDAVEYVYTNYGKQTPLNHKENNNQMIPEKEIQFNVLVTGSLHLVGGVLDVTNTPIW